MNFSYFTPVFVAPQYSSRVSWHQNNPPISCEIPSLVCLCQLVGCFIGWFCRLGARLVGLLVAKETPPKATSIHPQVHIAPFSILVKNLQNALLDITTKDITRERSLPVAFIAWCDLYKPYKIRECSLPTAYIDVTSFEKTTKCNLLEITNQHRVQLAGSLDITSLDVCCIVCLHQTDCQPFSTRLATKSAELHILQNISLKYKYCENFININIEGQRIWTRDSS